MGIVNVTADSFSDGGKFFDTGKAVPGDTLEPKDTYELEGRSMAVLLTRIASERLDEGEMSESAKSVAAELVAAPESIERYRPSDAELVKK